MLSNTASANGPAGPSTTAGSEPCRPPWKLIQERNKEQLRSNLVRSGNQFIHRFLELLEEKEAALTEAALMDTKKQYLQKVLHAIFFFGQIHATPVEPGEFLPEPCQDEFRRFCPAPFEQRTTHLPTKTPYSILLDYVTEVKGLTIPQQIMSFLQNFNAQLWTRSAEASHGLRAGEFTFTAAVIAYCFYGEPKSGAEINHFYGASLSCKGRHERRIMIDLSSIKTWHKAVAYTVQHGDAGLAIAFPEGVWSQAFQFKAQEQRYQAKSPCQQCQKIFQHVNFQPPPEASETLERWEYGNCAEVESFSKLLRGSRVVEKGVQATGACSVPKSCEAIEREFTASIEAKIKTRLISNLRSRKFQARTLQVFEPQ